jgi:hypothetical protein
MATGAAWLTGSRFTERRKKKCALTSNGLLMEGAKQARGEKIRQLLATLKTVLNLATALDVGCGLGFSPRCWKRRD